MKRTVRNWVVKGSPRVLGKLESTKKVREQMGESRKQEKCWHLESRMAMCIDDNNTEKDACGEFFCGKLRKKDGIDSDLSILKGRRQ